MQPPMENLLSYDDIGPLIGGLQLQVINLSKGITVRDARIAQLERELMKAKGEKEPEKGTNNGPRKMGIEGSMGEITREGT